MDSSTLFGDDAPRFFGSVEGVGQKDEGAWNAPFGFGFQLDFCKGELSEFFLADFGDFAFESRQDCEFLPDEGGGFGVERASEGDPFFFKFDSQKVGFVGAVQGVMYGAFEFSFKF